MVALNTQWVVQLGRFDIAVHIMTLSSFRAQPKRGHLDRIKKVIRYLLKMDREAIRICTEMPDNSDGVIERYDWSKTVYAGSEEEIPHDIPTLKGKPVRLVTYVMILILITTFLMVKLPRASCALLIKHHLTGILRSKQATPEVATFSTEELAARTAVEQSRANRLTFMYIGVPIEGPSVLLGDNESVVKGMNIPHRKLNKRHLILSWHYVRQVIITGTYDYVHIPGKINPKKHWSYGTVWGMLRPILSWQGDTRKLA